MKYLPFLIAIVLLFPTASFAEEPETPVETPVIETSTHRPHPSGGDATFFFGQIKDLLPVTLDEQTKTLLWNNPTSREIIKNIWRIKTFGY